VGQVTRDTRLPHGYTLHEQRLDETEAGEGTTVTLIDAKRPADWVRESGAEDIAGWLGFARAPDLAGWDVFDAVLAPGDIILLMSWRDQAAAEAFEAAAKLPDGSRFRRIRVIRDYGMFDRREAPQFYPDAEGIPTVHPSP
jgi:hypothetical protein